MSRANEQIAVRGVCGTRELWLLLPAALLTLALFVALPLVELFSRAPDTEYMVRSLDVVELPAVKEPLHVKVAPKVRPRVLSFELPAPQVVTPNYPETAVQQVALITMANYDAMKDWALDLDFLVPALVEPVFAVGELDQVPRSLVQVRPVYPLRARNRRIEGYVLLEYVVTDQGLVEQVQVVESVPAGLFDQSALRSTASWRFEPGQKQGRAVATRIEQKLTYTLQD